MEAVAETLIGTYLTRGGRVFIVPQYSIPPSPDSKGEWSCPDFVALDFEREPREVVVVEVTTASNINPFIEKAINRKKQWFEPLYAKLLADRIIDTSWDIRFLGFVRKDNFEKARAKLSGHDKVTIAAIEDATFSWKFWEVRQGGLPR